MRFQYPSIPLNRLHGKHKLYTWIIENNIKNIKKIKNFL